MRAALRRSPVLATGLALLLSATACGGSGRSSPTPVAAAEDTTTTTTTDAGAAYAGCLREHGATLPDRPPRTGGAGDTPPSSRPPGSRPPGSRPSTSLPAGTDQAAFQAAREACKALLPADRPNGPGMQSAAFQVYASCLKDHGVVLPAGGGFGGVNRDDAAFKAADTTCAPLRPAQGAP